MINIKKVILVTIMAIMICPVNVEAFEMPTGRTKMEQGLKQYIEEVCEEYNVCPDLVIAMAERESGLKYNARSSVGCIGLLQIYPKYNRDRMKRLGVTDLTNPKQNALVAIDLIAELFDKYGEVYAVLMYYNGGYGSKYGLKAYERGNISNYAKQIAKRSEELQAIREYDEAMKNRELFEDLANDIKRRYLEWKNCKD